MDRGPRGPPGVALPAIAERLGGHEHDANIHRFPPAHDLARAPLRARRAHARSALVGCVARVRHGRRAHRPGVDGGDCLDGAGEPRRRAPPRVPPPRLVRVPQLRSPRRPRRALRLGHPHRQLCLDARPRRPAPARRRPPALILPRASRRPAPRAHSPWRHRFRSSAEARGVLSPSSRPAGSAALSKSSAPSGTAFLAVP